jgi:predicted metal-dependent phosphoesterase TrpH
MIFELHCHTHYSRGTKIPTEVMMPPRDVVRLARKAGIDFLAITDHKVATGWKEAREEARNQGIKVIQGMEIQSQEGHILGLGLNEPVENFLSGEETLERIREQGGFSVAPHPYDIKNDGVRDLCLKADAAEVFNSFVLDRLSNWYAQRRVASMGRPMVVGSDVHMPEMMGLAVNVAEAQDLEGFFREARLGRVGFRTSYVPIASVVSWARSRLYHSYDDVMRYIESSYPQPKKWLSRTMMNNFIGSTNRLWNVFGAFAVGCSALYSGLKLLTY